MGKTLQRIIDSCQQYIKNRTQNLSYLDELMKSTSNKILIVNIALIVLMFLASYFWIEIGLTDNENIYLGLIGVIIFGLAVGGLFTGISKRKLKGKITLNGIIENSLLTILFLVVFIYVIAEMT